MSFPADPPIPSESNPRPRLMLIGVVLAFFLLAQVRNAWVCDDAYLTFRTIDNFVHGYGLRWNIDERVQAYTHPLWLLVLTPIYFVTREAYFCSIALSLLLTLAAALLLSLRIARSIQGALLGLILLTVSKAFVDYSTSGLENPLTHLILALYFWLDFTRPPSSRKAFSLSLLAALGTLNRMDLILIFLPTLLDNFWRVRSLRSALLMIAGFIPFALWEIFSVVYYGFPFPNTAYAKLNTGVPKSELLQQGFFYFLNSLNLDPITPLVIGLALVFSLGSRESSFRFWMAGILLYLFYVLRIGGDAMSGRFLAAPFLCSVLLLSRLEFSRFEAGLFASLALAISLFSPYSPVKSDGLYGPSGGNPVRLTGISDEREYYYQAMGLLNGYRGSKVLKFTEMAADRQARPLRPATLVLGAVGIRGYIAGPSIHVVDILALGDPLLARLPASRDPEWRIAHFARKVPFGYLASFRSADVQLKDKKLAQYYKNLLTIIRDRDLFTPDRWRKIFKMNTGSCDDLIDRDFQRDPYTDEIDLQDINEPMEPHAGNRMIRPDGRLGIDLGKSCAPKFVEFGLEQNDGYVIAYLRGGLKLASQTIPAAAPEAAKDLTVVRTFPVPAEAAQGFDRIEILPGPGDGRYSVGHVRLLDSP